MKPGGLCLPEGVPAPRFAGSRAGTQGSRSDDFAPRGAGVSGLARCKSQDGRQLWGKWECSLLRLAWRPLWVRVLGTSRADPRKIRQSHRFSRLTQAIGRPDVPGGASDP